jgi:hypothetical protein
MMLAVATGLACPTLATDVPPEPIDAEFLDYLANYEGQRDNWTVVASEQERRKAPAQAEAAKPDPRSKAPPADAANPGVKP